MKDTIYLHDEFDANEPVIVIIKPYYLKMGTIETLHCKNGTTKKSSHADTRYPYLCHLRTLFYWSPLEDTDN